VLFVGFSRSQNCEKRLLASSWLSIRLSKWNNSAVTGRIFMKFDISLFFSIFRKAVEKIQVSLEYDTRITGTLHEADR
jgi:hypothetical protein